MDNSFAKGTENSSITSNKVRSKNEQYEINK